MSEIHASRSRRFNCLLPAFIRCRFLIRQECGYFCGDVFFFVIVFVFDINGENISCAKKFLECFECFAGKQPQSMLKTSHRHFYLAKKITFNLLPKVFQAIHSLTKMSCTVRASEQRNFQTKRYWKNRFLKAYNKQTRPKYCAVACQSGSNREWEAYLLKNCSLENPHIQTDMHFQTTIELLLTLVLKKRLSAVQKLPNFENVLTFHSYS